MIVKLTYFKPTSGKYYSNGYYRTGKKHMHEIFDEVSEAKTNNSLPDIVGSDWIILIDVPEHENNHPALVL